MTMNASEKQRRREQWNKSQKNRRAALKKTLRKVPNQGKQHVKKGNEQYGTKVHQRTRKYEASTEAEAEKKSSPKEVKRTTRRVDYEVGPFDFSLRPGTSDESTLEQIFSRHVYDRSLREAKGRYWLDLGAHCGMFALRALQFGAMGVFCYECLKVNHRLLQQNTVGWPAKAFIGLVELDPPKSGGYLYASAAPHSATRHTTKVTRGRLEIFVRQTYSIRACLSRHRQVTAVKLDIEGSELDILEHFTWPKRISLLVVEYSFSNDPDVKRFRRIIAMLRKQFRSVSFPPSALNRPMVDGKPVVYHDRDVMVHCSGRR